MNKLKLLFSNILASAIVIAILLFVIGCDVMAIKWIIGMLR